MKRKRSQRMRLQRGIYVLPNLLTSANLFCGFYAIVSAIQGHFLKAAMAIMVAAVFDALDGKIARVTRTVSRFGLEYDSLCDAISFGVAPGILVYLWALQPFGRLGWLAALLFVACGTLRLARFNTQVHVVGSDYFNGLPIPAAAFMIATTVLLLYRFGWTGTTKHVTILIMIYVLSFLMVSTIKYYSFKQAELFKKMKFNMLVSVVLLFIVIAAEPSITFFVIMLSYVLSGPFTTLWLRKKRQDEAASGDRLKTPHEEPV
ncbi:MAG: CDP-diacylglycerol--serine O-phosphatidyltransferase [Deltaproteobacteria bacterium]|nr:CDP-diacylglycerol--serine O-phosphatidyltransferase [Deltaproteobacteria bacterium]MBW2075502.1 CDP-diacylglycerol--serine O-phosphatidyltransferase [Deltaproteobacteria bacterium]